jgi:hypothetical protein
VSFFEPPPPPEPEEHHQPVWLGPPENEVGLAMPLNMLLARSDDVAVALLNITAFSAGFEITGTVRTRAAR